MGVFGASLGGGVVLFEFGIADELLSLGVEVVDGAASVPYWPFGLSLPGAGWFCGAAELSGVDGVFDGDIAFGDD